MDWQYEIAGNQIDGARDYQEDAFLVTHLTDAQAQPATLAIVADGMGGHAAGNVASNMAVQAFNKHVISNYPSNDLSALLQGGVLKANNTIAVTIRETPALQGMGCTMIAVLVDQQRLWWASVGDSHLYLLRGKSLTKMNADQSYGGLLDRLAAAGQPAEPEPGLSRNMLMSAVTGEEIKEIDCPEESFQLEHGDRLLLCSDGLNTLSQAKIVQYAERNNSALEYARGLLDAVAEAAMPRQDNTTVIVINVSLQEVSSAEPRAVAASTGLATGDADAVELTDRTLPNFRIGAHDTAARTATPAPAIAAAGANAHTAINAPVRDKPRKLKVPVLIAGGVALLAIIGGTYLWTAGNQPTPETAVPSIEHEPATVEVPIVAEPQQPPASRPDPVPQEATEPAVEIAGATIPPEPEPKTGPQLQPTFTDRLQSGAQGPVMQPLVGGSFMMGGSRFSEEQPEHKVTVKPFAISRYEITVADYARFARAAGRAVPNPFGLDKATHPVVSVTWQQAADYAAWLSQQTGHAYRLPTEAEWEYAASGGVKTDYWWGMSMEPNRAHCFSCGEELAPQHPTRIGSFSANPFGLHDMLGNVAEWVTDCWHPEYNGAPVVSDQAWIEGGNCRRRVVRGGSYSTPPTSLRHSQRDKYDAASGYENIGFRVVREMAGEE